MSQTLDAPLLGKLKGSRTYLIAIALAALGLFGGRLPDGLARMLEPSQLEILLGAGGLAALRAAIPNLAPQLQAVLAAIAGLRALLEQLAQQLPVSSSSAPAAPPGWGWPNPYPPADAPTFSPAKVVDAATTGKAGEPPPVPEIRAFPPRAVVLASVRALAAAGVSYRDARQALEDVYEGEPTTGDGPVEP